MLIGRQPQSPWERDATTYEIIQPNTINVVS